MVDKQHKPVELIYIANSCDTDEQLQDIVDSYLQDIVDSYLSVDIYAKLVHLSNGDLLGYTVYSTRHRIEEHLSACGYTQQQIEAILLNGSFNAVEEL